MKSIFNPVMLLIFALAFSCAKKRETEFSQGTGVGLLAIKDYQGKTIAQDTQSDAKEANNPVSSAEKVNINENYDNPYFRSFQIVNFNKPHELLEGVPMRGEPGKRYQVLFELTKHKLILNKVLAEQEIPAREKTYAILINNGPQKGKFKIPLVGYPASLVRVETVLNSNKEATDKMSEYPARELTEATHFRIDKGKKELFEAVSKMDIFPKSMFEGEWFYSTTIVSAPESMTNANGADLSTGDFSYQKISRVNFRPQQEYLRVSSTNVAEGIDVSKDENQRAALEIPIEWVQFRLKQEGTNAGIQEELVDNEKNDAKDWQQLKYMKLKLTDVVFPFASRNRSRQQKPSLRNLVLDNDYFSFSIYYPDYRFEIKFAFVKADAPVKGTVYHEKDWYKFGFFNTVKNFNSGNYENESKEAVNKHNFLNRFYPKKTLNPETGKEEKTILFHFSHRTPQRFKELSRKSIKAWDETFAKAGSDIRVALADDNDTVSLGDLRYNIINIIDAEGGGGGGYGPSIADSKSGEIISATSNVYVNSYRYLSALVIRNYILYRLGALEGTDISNISIDRLSPGSTQSLSTSGMSDAFIPTAAQDFLFEDEEALAKQKEILKNVNNLIRTDLQLSKTPSLSLTNRINNLIRHSVKKEKTYGYTLLKRPEFKPIEFKRSPIGYEFEQEDFNLNKLDALFTADLIKYRKAKKLEQEQKDFISSFFKKGTNCSYPVNRKDMVAEIERKCTGDDVSLSLDNYISKIKKSNESRPSEDMVYKTDEEVKYIDACIERIIDDQLQATLIHELGHNFGLRHNFLASADKLNYQKTEDGTLIKQSSTMDYAHYASNEPIVPGPYDIAAIRFGYTNSVEIVDSDNRRDNINSRKTRVVELKDLSKTINENISTYYSGSELYPYLFCTDERTGFWRENPLCNRWDAGNNPEELAKYYINEFNNSYQLLGHKHHQQTAYPGWFLAYRGYGRYFTKLIDIYQNWRLRLRTRIGTDKEYLESASEKEIQAIIDKISKSDDERDQEDYSYYKAGDLVYKFLKNLAFSPVKYCSFVGTYKMENGSSQQSIFPMDFETIRNKVYNDTQQKVQIHDCNHDNALIAAQEILKDKILKDDFVSARHSPEHNKGQFFNDLRVSMKTGEYPVLSKGNLLYSSTRLDQIKVSGLKTARFFALYALGNRWPQTYKFYYNMENENFFLPGFLDNPKYRQEFEDSVVERILYGLRPSIFNDDFQYQDAEGNYVEDVSALDVITREEIFQNQNHSFYLRESELLTSMYYNLVYGQLVPGKQQTNLNRIRRYSPRITDQVPDQIRNNPDFAIGLFNDSFYLVAHREDNPISFKVIKRWNILEQVKEIKDIYPKDLDLNKLQNFTAAIPAFDTYADYQKAKFIDLASLLDKVNELLMEYFPDPKHQAYLREYYIPYESNISSMIISAGLSADVHGEENADQVLQDTFEISFGNESSFPFSEDGYANRLKEMQEQYISHGIQVEVYERDESENDAQLELLSRLLLVI